MRTTKKTLSLILVMAMVLTLFAGVAQASGSVTITADATRVTDDGKRIPGTIVIRGDDVPVIAEAGDRVEVDITLPEDVEWEQSPTSTFVLTPGVTSTVVGSLVDFERTARFVLTTAGPPINRVQVLGTTGGSNPINNYINIPDGFSGALNAEVQVTGRDEYGIFLWRETSTVRIATVVAERTIARVRDAKNILRGAGNQLVGRIDIAEDLAGALTEGGRIRLTVPDGVTFAGVPSLTGGVTFHSFADSYRRLLLTVGTFAGRQTIAIENIRLNVSMAVADGPVNIVIDNGTPTADVTGATLTVATVGVGAVTVARQGDLPDAWNLGRVDREIGDIRLAEVMAGALTPNRTVTLTLPVGYTWHTAPTDADNAFEGTYTVSDGGRTLTYWTRTTATGSRTDFDLENGRINARIDAAPGDVVVTVGGNAGASGTAVVATSRRPVTVTVVSTPNVRANELNQLVGNIVITENFAGALRAGNLEISVPALTLIGASASVSDVVGSEPSARAIATGRGTIEVPVAAAIAPTNPATVTVSGIRGNLGLATLINAGAITADVAGSAILDSGSVGIAGITSDEAVGTVIANDIVVANLVGREARRTVFTVGATAFTVDGVAQTLDVAPVIQDGRTMMPIRAAANAAGVTNENILFEAGVITIIRGDRVAQFTLGSRVMVVNGVAMNMDVAPALVAGRALIPVRWVGTALGVPVAWDSAAQTVTVTVQ